MENYDTYKQAISEAEKAEGTAARKMEAYNESIAYSINQLSAAWEGFTQKLEASGAVKTFFTGLTLLIENFGTALSMVLSTVVSLRSFKLTTDLKRLADFFGFESSEGRDRLRTKWDKTTAWFSPNRMTQQAAQEKEKYEQQRAGTHEEQSRNKVVSSNNRVVDALNRNAEALDRNSAAQRGESAPQASNTTLSAKPSSEQAAESVASESKIPRNPWLGVTGSTVSVGAIKKARQEYEVAKQKSDQYAEGVFVGAHKKTADAKANYDRLRTLRVQELKANWKQGAIRGVGTGLTAGIISGMSAEGDVQDKIVTGASTAITTGLLSAIPGVGTILGPILGPILGGFFGKEINKLLKADEVARKERVEEAKEQLEAIKGIGSSVTGLIDLNKKDQSLWDSDDWKQFNEQVETINEALEKSELGDRIIDLGNRTQTLSEYFEEAARTGNKDMLARVEAEKIRFEAEKTYAAGEQDRYDLQKEINENQKKLANLDDDEISKKKELNAAIKAAKAEIEDYSEALKKGYMEASFYSSGVGTMESYDIGNATLDRVIMQIAREWAKDSPDIFAGNQLTSDARSDIISYLREQSGYSSLFKNDTKNVRDMLNAEKAVENLRTTLGMSQKQLKEFANSKDLSEIADKFGATGDALYKIIDQVNLVDEDGISTIAHAMNMTVEQFREANSEGAFDWLTTDVAIGGLDKLNEKLATFNELLLAVSENSLFSQENINKIVSQYPTLLKKIDEETGKISVSMDNVQENLVDILAGGESLRKVYAGFFSRDIATSAEKWDVFISSIREDIEKDSALDGFRDEIFKQTNYSGFLKVYEEHKNELESYNQSFIEYAKSLFSTDVFDTRQEILTKYATSTLETEISNLESIRDSLDEVNKQREKEIELIKAKEALENASKEKKRVYRAGVGFVYTTDQEAVKSAQEKVDELERQRDKDDIQYQIDSLQQQKEILENIKDNEQLKALQETAKKTLEALGVKGALVTAILSGSKEEFNAAIKAGLDKDIENGAVDARKQEENKALKEYYDNVYKLEDLLDESKIFTGEYEEDADGNINYLAPKFKSATDKDIEEEKERYGGLSAKEALEATNSIGHNLSVEDQKIILDKIEAAKTGLSSLGITPITGTKETDAIKTDKTERKFTVKNPGRGTLRSWGQYGTLRIAGDIDNNDPFKNLGTVDSLSYAIVKPNGEIEDWKKFDKNKKYSSVKEAIEQTIGKNAALIMDDTGDNTILYKEIGDYGTFKKLEGYNSYTKTWIDATTGEGAKGDSYVWHGGSFDRSGTIYNVYKKGNKYGYGMNDVGLIEVLEKIENNKVNGILRNMSVDDIYNEFKDDVYSTYLPILLQYIEDIKKEPGAFASGTLSAPGGRSLINENGLESIITPSGTITSLPAKSGIVPADLTRNLWALGEVAPNLIARLGGNSLQTNNSNSSTDNSINIQNLDATFNTQSDFDGHRFLTDLRNQVILTANNH